MADEGYEIGSDSMDLPTPLMTTPHILHVSSLDHTSFNPTHTTPRRPVTTTPSRLLHTPTSPVCHHLSFDSDSDHKLDTTPMQVDNSDGDQDAVPESSDKKGSSAPESSDEEEDFPIVPIDDEHWTTEMVLERTFCIHENGLCNNVCHYPCPFGDNNTASYMDSLDLSDISDYEDYMLTTSDDEVLPGLEEVPY